ncbi:MAG: M6 family metalloprotease domain-containing protein, partial [Prevotella sp.]|nr:M6 family metalloprotease domain-containing protein [Prevotella sp.]
MKHTALLIISLLLSHCVMAQQTFRRRQCGTAMLMEREAAAYSKGQRAISTQNNYVPHTGTITIPVVLVNFKDAEFKINKPKEAFEQLFNSDTQADLGNRNDRNYGSVAKYFRDMSHGAFTPKFKVYDPVTVDKPETYYGGKNEDDNSDEEPRLLVKDALKLVEDQVKENDITSFCSDGKTIDCVYIVYAGLGQNDGGDGTTVWANCWTTDGATLGGKKVRWYTMSGELSPWKIKDGTIPALNGLGVICHEFSHSLGLPDMYPTAESAHLDNQEMEYWDLMDGGEYTYNGFCPTAYTAFEKEQMGWPVVIETLNSDKNVTMTTSTEQGGTAYKIVNPQNYKEYLMLEYIQQKGWNQYLFGNGLLVYHVCLPSETLYSGTRLNNTPGYPGMAVVPADGACLSSYLEANENDYVNSLYGDLFPGTGNLQGQNVTELSDTNKQPNFCWYNATKTEKLNTNKAINNIKYDTGELTFDYVNDVASGILPVWGDKQATDGRVYSINGAYLGDDITKLPHGI